MKSRRSAATRKVNREKPRSRKGDGARPATVYPFSAIVGQDEMKLALVLNVIDPRIGGVLIMGQRGTGKSTAVRGLPELLPEMKVVRHCPYRCEPEAADSLCLECKAKLAAGQKLEVDRVAVRVVNLPLGATEDRVCGTIDIQRALQSGIKAFEPGLLARANRGLLYIDEVNLLDDHLVDVLLDAAATGRNSVEREGVSIEHPAQFVLIGSGNPEEGELRPQLQDRFGLHVAVTTDNSPDSRVAVVERREAFDRDREAFILAAKSEQANLRRRVAQARSRLVNLKVEAAVLRQIACLCSELSIDGHRGELTITRAARSLAAFENRRQVAAEDVRRVAKMALRHRLRRDALEETASADQIEAAFERVFASSPVQKSRDGGAGEWPEGKTGGSSRSNSRESKANAAKTQSRYESDPLGVNEGDDRTFNLAETPDLEARIQKLKTNGAKQSRVHRSSAASGNNREATSRSTRTNEERGRYRRAVSYRARQLALDATLRAIAAETGKTLGTRTLISPQSLRYKLFTRKAGSLFIFAIDTSGSMAMKRISQAKGALLRLLKKSYLNRDQVAVVSFGGATARVLLPPSRSMLRARRVLDSLSVGGGTPLSAALVCSLEIARRAAAESKSDLRLLIFTDGRANVPLRKNRAGQQTASGLLIHDELKSLGAELRRAGVSTLVVETENRFVSSDETRRLAEILLAQRVQIRSQPPNQVTTH